MRISPPIALEQKKSKLVVLNATGPRSTGMPLLWSLDQCFDFTLLAPDLSRTTNNDSDSSLPASAPWAVDSWRPSPWMKPSMLVQLDNRGSHATARFDPCKW
jgi:hypothetical protein